MKITKITKNESYNLYGDDGSIITTLTYEVPFLRNPTEIELFLKALIVVAGASFVIKALKG